MSSPSQSYSIVLGQRLPWPEMLARARETEVLGFDGLFLVDHFYGLQNVEQPTLEAYTMLAALAPFTQRVRLGVMVCGNTYRNPAFLLKQAITVDLISGGRVDFGVGAGWVEREHEAYGFDFPAAKERVDRFAEALEVWRLLQGQQRTTFEGTHYRLLDAPFQPKSTQPGGLPVLIGGSGPRMMRLIARYAAIWNAIGTPAEVAEMNSRMDEACAGEGRDPASLIRSVSPSNNLLASVQAFAEGIEAYHAAGFSHIYFPWPRVEAELPVLRAVAREIMPGLRGKPLAVADVDVASLQAIDSASRDRAFAVLGALGDRDAARVLNLLIEHPGEQFSGPAIMAQIGIARHADVTRAFASARAAFAGQGLAVPWIEGQRGWHIPPEIATHLHDTRAVRS